MARSVKKRGFQHKPKSRKSILNELKRTTNNFLVLKKLFNHETQKT